jgi:alpha-galactosidase
MLFSSLLVSFIGLVAAQLPLHNRAIAGCYPVTANSTGGELVTIKTAETPNGFTGLAKGWNSWGIQASPKTTPSYPDSIAPYVDQAFIIEQCTVLANATILAAGFNLCSIDGGWYSSETDDYGRVTYNTTLFDLPTLGTYLHGLGLLMGVYNLPGIPCNAANKTIYGTDVTVGSTFNGVEDQDGYCYFDYTNPNTQVYHNTLIALWASWGVDMIKLDYLTPGSSVGSLTMPANVSASAIAHHEAIVNSGRQIRLDLSSNVCRNSPYLGIWEASAESMRVATDINSYGASTFVGMWLVQNSIEQYRQYINQLVAANATMTLHPDMDDLFVGNPASVTGVTDNQRITLMSHWIGASANLILGSDMKNLDALGMELIAGLQSKSAAKFCAVYPMQPRNPGTGSNQPMQLQAWIAGPDPTGQAYVLLTNLGPNLGKGGFVTVGTGVQDVTISLADLGLTASRYVAKDVWFGNATFVKSYQSLTASLDEGESRFWQIYPN